MNTFAFIRDARNLLTRISSTATLPDGDTKEHRRRQIQADLDFLCNNMTNPSLPTSYKLVTVASRNKYTVESKVFHRVNQFA